MTAVVAPASTAPEAAPETGAGSPAATSRRRWLTAACILSYFALAVIAFLPASPFDSRAIPAAPTGNPAGSDPFQMMWFLAWFPYAVTHGLNIFHTNLFDYPGGVNLADNTSVPLLGLLGWPVTATLGPVASFNFLLRVALALSGTSMFLVLRRWCTSTIAPFAGGLLYAFGPYMMGQELHLDLVFIPIPPILVWCGDELLRTQRMRPWCLGIMIGAAAAAQLLISPDVLSGCLVLAAAAGIGLAVRFRHEVRERIGYIAASSAVALATFLVVCGYLIWQMVAGANHLTGAVIPPSALQGLHTDLLGPLAPTRNQLLMPHFLASLGDGMVAGNLSENGAYLGLPLLIFLVAVARWQRGDAVVRTLSWLALFSFLISLGPSLSIANRSTHIPLPEAVFAHIPLLDNTIPARYSLYVSLFVSLVAAIGLDRLWARRHSGSLLSERWRSRLGPLGADTPQGRRARVGIAAGLIVLSLLPAVPLESRGAPWPPDLTKEMRAVVPPGSVVLAYPYPTPLHPGALLWEAQAGMDFHLLGGYANIQIGKSGHRWPALLSPPYVQELLGYTKVGDHWPAPGAPNAADLDALHIFLARYGVGAVVYWAGGDNRGAVYDYLADALGPPAVRTDRIAIWVPSHGHWRGAAANRA